MRARIKETAEQDSFAVVEAISKIIQCEARKKRLGQIKYSTNKDREGATYSVQVKEDTGEVAYTTEDGIFGQVKFQIF